MIKEELFEPVPMLFGGSGIIYAKNGAKLENIEVSEEPSVIPEGQLHKNKNEISEVLDTTKKGIPVISLDTDKVESFSEIQERSDTLVQHCEIEREEIIFAKPLTNFLEEKRKEYHESEDPEILLEVGKRLTKEILENTSDNTDLIETIEEKL